MDFAELARAASSPAMEAGPRDLAPLAREASIRRLELIFCTVQNGAFALCAFLSCFRGKRSVRPLRFPFMLSRKTERSPLALSFPGVIVDTRIGGLGGWRK